MKFDIFWFSTSFFLFVSLSLLWLLIVIVAHCDYLPKALWLSLLTTTHTNTNTPATRLTRLGWSLRTLTGILTVAIKLIGFLYRFSTRPCQSRFYKHETIPMKLSCVKRWWLLYESKNASACSKAASNLLESSRITKTKQIFLFLRVLWNIIRRCYFNKHTVWKTHVAHLHALKQYPVFSYFVLSISCSIQYVYKSSSNLIYQLILWDPCFDGCYTVYSRHLFLKEDVLVHYL